jgi:hypothetical protein
MLIRDRISLVSASPYEKSADDDLTLSVQYCLFEARLSTKGTGLPVPKKRDNGRL